MAHAPNGNVVPLGDHPRARARLTPQESATVLSGCRDLALDRMTRAMSGMLDAVEDELLALADKSGDREARNVFLDARAQARQKRYAMEATFRQHFAEFFNRKVRGDSAPAARPPGELSLVEDDDLEETLAVSEMSRKLKTACEGELFALRARMGFLLERPDLEEDANPVSPATICAALKDACDQIEAGARVRMALLHQIERHTEGLLQGLYRDLNAHLVERSILPEVRPTARRNAASGAPAKRDAPPPAAPTPAPPADLFATLAQLLGPASGTPAMGVAGGAPIAAGGEAPPFVAELTRMHRADAGAAAFAPAAGADALYNVVRDLKSGPHAASLGALDATTIDIVAMLFDYVFEDRHIPDFVKAQLGRLQIPTLKVALLDKTFFSSKEHPARRLIDALAAASIGVDGANARGAATLALVEEVVARVLDEFDTDLELFESLVERVESFVAEGKEAEEALVARSAALIEAREREEIARAIADDEVARRLVARMWVPAPVREMLLETWARALAEAQREAGEGGASWQSLTRTMDELLWSVEPKTSADDRKRLVAMLPGMLRELHQGFARGKMTAAEQDVFLGALVDCHSNAVKAGLRGLAVLPEVPSPVVAQEPRIERELVPAGDVQVEEIRLKAPRGSAVRNVFTRTGIWTNLQRGTWVEFARDCASATRARLTWISPNKGVYLFTNPASSAVAVSISPEALAEQMRRGEARMLDGAPLVERAVDSMIATLKRGEASPA
jgi:uncharacterized protein DUF1631